MKRAAVPSILVVVVLLALGVTAEAQQAKKLPRVGVLDPNSPQNHAIRSALGRAARAWYVEGKTSSSSTGTQRENLIAYPIWPQTWLVAELMSSCCKVRQQSAPPTMAGRGA
jgi:hypothetical protein